MKNSIYLIWKNTIQALLFGLSLISFLITSPVSGQTTKYNALNNDQGISSLKSSNPEGENIIISKMDANHSDKDSYIQIYNADVLVIDLSGWTLVGIENGKEICTWTLSGTIKPGESKTAGDNNNHLFTPDFINSSWHPGNNKWDGNNDGARLYKDGNLIDDAYSTTNWTDGVIVRNESEGSASTSFNAIEWSVFDTSFDETYHDCRLPIINIGPGLWSELTTDYARGASYNIQGIVEVDINTPAECYSIYIQKDNNLIINALSALTINKNLNNYGSNTALTIKANSSGTGSLIIKGYSDNGTMEQYFEDTKLQNWEFISSPVENAKSAIYENDYLMYYYEPQMRYVSITPTTTSLKVGRGYTVKKAQDNIEKYEGIFNSGEIQIPTLTNTLGTPYSTDEQSGWNLIGNPYTSSINWDKVELPSKIHGQASVWVVTTIDGVTVSDWKVWVKGLWGGLGYGLGQGFGDQEAHYIDPGESFFVFSTGTENLSFTSDVQEHHFEESSTKSTPDPVLNEVMEIKATGNNFNSSFYLRFLEGSTLGFDSDFDAFKRLSESKKLPQIYNTAEETILAANSIPAPAEDDVMHLSFTCGIDGNYSLDFSGIEGFDFAQGFYLKDNLTGNITNLRQDPSVEFSYTTSDPKNRFDLLFGLINGTDDLNSDEFATTIYSAAENIYIRTDYPQAQKLRVEVRNLLGQTIFSSATVNDFFNGKNLNLTNGTYLISLSDNSYLITKKVTVYN